MTMDSQTNTEREQRNGWALSEQNMPTEVVGYACPDDYWWCPRIGFSIPGSTLYATEQEAADAAVRRLREERDRIDSHLRSLGAVS